MVSEPLCATSGWVFVRPGGSGNGHAQDAVRFPNVILYAWPLTIPDRLHYGVQ